jgi:hypothetical protein
MVLGKSGKLSLNQIGDEFGIPAGPVRLSQLYLGAGIVPNNSGSNAAVPSAGAIRFGHFWGAASLDLTTPVTVSIPVSYDSVVGTPQQPAFQLDARMQLAVQVGVPLANVTITSLAPGSIVVTFNVRMPATGLINSAAVSKLAVLAAATSPIAVFGDAFCTKYSLSSPTSSLVVTARSPPQLLLGGTKALPAVAAAAAATQLALSDLFSSPGTLTYAVTGSQYATIAPGPSTLSVTGAYRGTSYTVYVTATDAYGTASAAAAVLVTELSPPSIAVLAVPALTGLTSSVATVSLAAYFNDPAYGSILAFSLTSDGNPLASAAVSGGTLTVTPASRGVTYTVKVRATNQYGASAVVSASVTELDRSSPLTGTLIDVMSSSLSSSPVAVWGPLAQTNVSYRPTYVASGGYTNGGYLATTSDTFMQWGAGGASLPFYSGGGFTWAGVYKVTAHYSGWERLIQINQDNGAELLAINRYAATTDLRVYCKLSQSSIAFNVNIPGLYATGTWLTVIIRYTNATKSIQAWTTTGTTPSTTLTGSLPLTANQTTSAVGPMLGQNGNASGAVSWHACMLAPYPLSDAQVASYYTYMTFDPLAPTITNPLGPTVSLTTNTVSYTMSSYFSTPVGSTPITYTLASNPKGNASIAAGVLSIVGANRGSTYTVTVTATNTNNKTASQSIDVTEAIALPVARASYDFRSATCYTGSGSNTVTDLSGNGYNLTFNTAPTFVASPRSVTVGSNKRATSALLAVDVASGYSLEVLFKFTSNPGNFMVVAGLVTTTDQNGVQIQVSPESVPYMWNNAVGNGSYSSVTAANTWYHVVFTSSGIASVNNVAVTNSGFNNALNVTNRMLLIGDLNRAVNGSVALYRFYSSALSKATITTLYADAKTGGNPYGLP